MNKVGLLTIHDTVNFGSLLQTYATYKAIENLGVKVILVDYKCKAIQQRENLYKLKDCRTPKDFIKHLMNHRTLQKKYDNFWRFIKSNMRVSKAYNELNIDKANDIFDSFIVGSDIVWGEEITGCDFNYMLEFAKDKKGKIAFSSSVGEDWNAYYEDHIKLLLSRFSAITVREEKAAKWIEHLIGRHIDVTCDPTMLMNTKFWNHYTNRSLVPKREYVLIYLRTSSKNNIEDAIKYGRKNNLIVCYINYGKPIKGIKNIKPKSIEEWLSLVKFAHTIFTASYHGYLYSLYFNKNFFFYYNTNTWRMESLTKWLNISYREGTEKNISNDRKINYVRINEMIKDRRRQSLCMFDRMLVDSGIKQGD